MMTWAICQFQNYEVVMKRLILWCASIFILGYIVWCAHCQIPAPKNLPTIPDSASKFKVCDCEITRECTCYESECVCPTCARTAIKELQNTVKKLQITVDNLEQRIAALEAKTATQSTSTTTKPAVTYTQPVQYRTYSQPIYAPLFSPPVMSGNIQCVGGT